MSQTKNKPSQEISILLANILSEDEGKQLNMRQRRRLEITIRTYLGQSQKEICDALGCSKDTARYWMAIAQTEKADSWQTLALGRPKRVNQTYLKRLKELVTSSPQEHGYSFQRWTAGWLSQHLAQELNIEISDRHVNRLLKQMGLSTRNLGKSQNTEEPVIKGQIIIIEDLNPSLMS